MAAGLCTPGVEDVGGATDAAGAQCCRRTSLSIRAWKRECEGCNALLLVPNEKKGGRVVGRNNASPALHSPCLKLSIHLPLTLLLVPRGHE